VAGDYVTFYGSYSSNSQRISTCSCNDDLLRSRSSYVGCASCVAWQTDHGAALSTELIY